MPETINHPGEWLDFADPGIGLEQQQLHPNAIPNAIIPSGFIVGEGPITSRKRKNYSLKNNDPIGVVFGCPDPTIINPVDAKKFLDLQDLNTKRPYIFSNPKTFIGVEVEVENVLKIDPNLTLMFWSVKEDGSLRNRGKEFVTPGVLSVNYLEPALVQLFRSLNNDIDFSHRTSIHFHLDVRQLTLQQLVAFVLTYTTVENLLFKYVGTNRRTNIFCVPITETGVMEHMGDDPKKFIWAVEKSWMKYTAFNLLPTATQGSVEFRHMPGTSNINKLLGWVEMICRLKTFVYKHSYDTIVDQILHLNSNSMYKQFVESIFGDMTAYLDMSNLLMDMEKPVYLAKNCSVSNTFHKKVLKNPIADSMLGSFLGAWMKNLTEDQLTALRELGDGLVGSTDLEDVLHQVVRHSASWKRAYPRFADRIDRVIFPMKQVETKKAKSVDIMDVESFNSIPPQGNPW